MGTEDRMDNENTGGLPVQLESKLAFTYQETARTAGISVAMVRKLVKDEKLRAIAIGRCRRIPRHAVLRLCGAKG